MKKLFLLAMGFLLTLAACQQDESIVDPASQSSFTVEIPQTAARAVTDQFGTGTSVNRCILEIYHGDQLYNRIEKGVTQKTVTFDNLRLVSSQTYDFVFWADCAEGSENNFTDKAYNTTSLKNITNQGEFVGNSDERDAFFAKKTLKVTGTFTENITLTRPFGLLIVKTNDLSEIKEEALKPTGYTVNFKGLPNTFNAFTGEVSGSADVTYTANELAKNDGTISMDFLWASENESALSDFTMTFLNGKNIICTNDAFTNIPIRRNYKTNVSGNLLTKQGNIEVTIDPNFAGEIGKEIVEVENITDVTAALQNGATNVIVKEAPTSTSVIAIPKTYEANNTNEISITLPAITQPVTVKYNNDTKNAPAEVNLNIPTSTDLVIELPNSTVTLNGQTYSSVTATTAANTLIVGEDVTISTLTLKGGSVKLYGIVSKLTKESGYNGTIYRCIGSQKSFENLKNDNISGYTEILVEECSGEIDGNGITLTKPMKVSTNAIIKNLRMNVPDGSTDNSKDYGGYGCCAILVVDGAENAIFENVVSNNGKNVRAFLLGGTTAGITARNCTFIVPNLANKAGLNILCMTNESVVTANLENCLIGVSETKLNVDKTKDYTYTEEMTSAAGNQTRGISIGRKEKSISQGRVNLNMKETVAEGISYVINIAGCNIYVDANIDNCIMDGRAALNLRGQRGGKYMIRNSKLIGRNWFPGGTENFATILYANDNQEWATKDQEVTLDATEIIAYSNPQTDTNWQYLADMRSQYRNRLELLNHSIFREINKPRLDYLVDITNPDVSEVIWDDTFIIEGKEGATVLPSWNGKSTEEVIPNSEGVYEISKAAQLAWVAEQVNSKNNSFEGKTIRLTSDINLYNREWTPIGNGSRLGSSAIGNQFKGTFDGNNKTVSRYTIYKTKGKDYALGLFGIVNGGIVKNFTIKNVDVYNNSEMAAAAVGMLTGGGTVSGVEVASGIVEVTRGNGGIVGRMIKGGTISNCTNRAKIIGTGANVGGIVGAAYYTAKDQNMTIENCHNYGTVSGSAGSVGGIVGLSAAKVTGCTNEANITGNGADVAGIVAEQQNAGSVTQCTNKGNITNKSKEAYGTGGIVGWIRYNGTTANYPVKNVISVTDNINRGNIDGGNDAGGIVGTVYNLGVINNNKNYATTLKAKTFAAGIVGNAQFTEKPEGMDEPNSVTVNNNVSNTPLSSITASNKDAYVYKNDKDAVTAEGNTGAN